ncbi:MAG: ATP-binding cassette domain-containing protein [Clostridia bacterium]|nr:ATP-binding cassette domain-containing protein [Clostridia bacterium]
MGLKVENVIKHFGEKLAVDNISFEMKEPGAFGLLGTNGAGKTTTIRMMLGIIKKDSGKITWNDKEVERKNVNFGYLPEERGIYPKTVIYEQLIYFAELKGMNKEEAGKEIDYWMKRLKVDEYKGMTAEKLSKGNQQKVQFITAILHDPELIVLDEPFSGLDPVNTELLKDVILELVEKGKYIIMSSHQMTSIEEFCSEVVIINKGKTVLKGRLKEIKDSYPAKKLEISTKQDVTSYIKELGMDIEKNIDNNYEIKIDNEEQAHTLMKNIVANNISIDKFELKRPSLNDIFIEKVSSDKE